MIELHRLSNGIRVVTDRIASAESVSLGVWVAVGARFETPELNGISHVLEHMAFKGTTTRSAFDISREVEDVGGILNAYTGKDMTAYYTKVLKKDWPLGLDIIADILQHSARFLPAYTALAGSLQPATTTCCGPPKRSRRL